MVSNLNISIRNLKECCNVKLYVHAYTVNMTISAVYISYDKLSLLVSNDKCFDRGVRKTGVV